MHPDPFWVFGVKMNREGATYEESTLFTGYPAKRPWYRLPATCTRKLFPLRTTVIPIDKGAVPHMGTPVFSTPAGHKQIAILRDRTKVPLFIACDIMVGETSMYADYIFPDTVYFERWGSPGGGPPAMLATLSKVRQPVVAPLPETTKVDGIEMRSIWRRSLLRLARNWSCRLWQGRLGDR